MKRTISLRVRMMLLFCLAVGILLAGSYVAFYFALSRVVKTQFDSRLLEAQAPVAADLATDTDDEDITAMNVPHEYFEMFNRSGHAVALSPNLKGHVIPWSGSMQSLQTVEDPQFGRLRLGVAPVHRPTGTSTLILAMSTRNIDETLARFREMLLILFPLSLLAMAGVSAWYVGRSLEPIAALTAETSRMAERVTRIASGSPPGQGKPFVVPLAAAHRRDELGRLAEAFNELSVCVDRTLRQLRQFVSDASHELRTPLSVLRGETEFLLKGQRPPEEYRRELQVIDAELKKLSRIVEALFTLAMADAGQLRLEREPLYLNEVLEEACALATPRARNKEILIERQLSEDIPYTGDETFFRQLFLIFLDNAVKYSRPRTRIRVSLGASNGSLQVQFADQGSGIPPEHLPYIFERFYRAPRADASDEEEAQSGGLGLAIAQAIVRAQGGRIDCRSEPGAGSTFTLTFPRTNEEGDQKP